MLREKMIEKLENPTHEWDLVVIGGGATGIGTAIEACSRGLKTLLVEQFDFSKGTSSRSTKLVHGGVRYLAQGNVSLVMEALRERGRMRNNAPHLVTDQSFVIPAYTWWGVPFYSMGLWFYDILSVRLSLGKSRPLTKLETLERVPTLKKKNLYGGIIYHDGQFDDSRMAINMVQTFVENGGVALNYMRVTGLIKNEGKAVGVNLADQESGKTYAVRTGAVVNATGVFVDEIRRMDDQHAANLVKFSQGVHLVIDRKFVPENFAIMIPKTKDGRVLFAVPWHNKVVVGTTDIQKESAEIEPVALQEEIDFILETAGRFLVNPPGRSDVLSVFAGLRPLAAPKKDGRNTKEISRGHIIRVSDSGLITVTGGKWTTYRKMAQDVIDLMSRKGTLKISLSRTDGCRIHGYKEKIDRESPFYFYGSDEEKILNLASEKAEYAELISEELHIIKAQVIWSVRHEMARTVEDFLARRTRALFLNARESVRMAPVVAGLMAAELNTGHDWIQKQLADYKAIASNYILD